MALNDSSLLLSVVICTRNRAVLLDSLLKTLSQQSLDRPDYEIVIVDNGSKDETAAIAGKYSCSLQNLRYVYEENVGLSHARNRGWKESNAKYIGYTDDDCRVPPEWLSVAAKIAKEQSPAGFCGPYYAWFDSPRPTWFKEEYGHMEMGKTARPLQPNEFPNGGNMFIRKDLLEHLEGFHVGLGMSGNQIAYGEETLFFRELREMVPEAVIYYDPDLYLYHLVRKEKMSLWDAVRRSFINGRYTFRIFGNRSGLSFSSTFRKFFYLLRTLIGDIVQGSLIRDRKKYPFLRNYLFECGLARIVQLGYNYENLRQVRKKED